MSFKDKIEIHEKLTVYVRNKDTGETKTKVIKKPWFEMTLLEKFLHVTGIKRQPGTIQNIGKDACAKLYGGATVGPAYAAINRVGVSVSDWKTATITWGGTGTGVVTYDNEANPWSSGIDTSNILLGNSGFASNPYHSISLSGSMKVSSSYDVWVEVELTIS